MNEKPKIPKHGGAQAAVNAVKKFRKQQPSEKLIKIVSEIPDTDNSKSKPDIAAKDSEI